MKHRKCAVCKIRNGEAMIRTYFVCKSCFKKLKADNKLRISQEVNIQRSLKSYLDKK